MHTHNLKVKEFGLNAEFKMVPLSYSCQECNEVFTTPPKVVDSPSDHSTHVDYSEGCFGCKILTLELNTGDAGRAESSMSQRKWDNELTAYRSARAQGIQPAGTTMSKINEARSASDKLGVAYDAGTMPAANTITKRTANVMKETKVI